MTVRLDSHMTVLVLEVALVGGLYRIERRAWASGAAFGRQRLGKKFYL